ncbi:MAG: NADH-quinone oxidoreductase subunit L [Gracilimonas sp.]|uniref:NADH-quinone oxidoreductase subunit L n=1 Tax=Gracilimonas TaxID=649462 RepID=UPI001B16CC51|nr:NADH-quinone oxidoreductase subunit L [Gracilimonas sp.]MBO6585900.1 NADH-quinone oxidoreductase subunit L [Gracilimonas sp.]MBO6616897.1 NADH-quinone oxidoreductase subunit L [Gracilimonas sp.]
MESATALFSLIIALPLAGFLINGIIGLFAENYRNKKQLIGLIANLAVFVPFAIAVYFFLNINADSEAVVYKLFTWMEVGSFSVDIAYRLDQLSILMTLVVTGVGFLIHLYSMGYMADDEGYWKFFAYLNLFIFAMLNLVLGNNLLLLFLGWEGVGVCSYLLIGFWYTDMAKSDAAKKAFIYNRIGDFAFLIAMFMVFQTVGSLSFDVILGNLDAFSGEYVFTIGLLMFIGATGKSAQIPLFVWLPDAMAGPTPVSALIHAATMVTSGIYLISRMSPMFVLSPEVMLIVAVVGALTAIVAATIAITQNDIKSVLAYSTVSQLGYMFLALGSGAFTAAMFHVVTHAFFKACLFLGSGSVIHAMHHVEHELEHEGKDVHFDPQDMRNMGGLRKYMPSTYKTFLISTIAIAGIPPLAGFFSKDEILAMTANAGAGEFGGYMYMALWGVGMITAFLTAFYMFRLTLTTFHGEFKLGQRFKEAIGAEKYLHESPATMTIPLWTLAGLAAVGGFLGVPNFVVETFTGETAHINLLHNWLYNINADYELILGKPIKWGIMAFSIVIAIAGTWTAFRMYNNNQQLESDAKLADRFGGLYQTWKDKYNLDEVYEGLISDPIVKFSDKVLAVFDMKVVDGIVNATAGTVRLFGSLFRYVQTGVVSSYALAFVIGVIVILYLMIM